MFKREDIMIEEFVQLFVGVIDAKLLEGVAFKIFESKDIQNPNELSHFFS